MTADTRTRNGFALVVVLSILSIIALLIASSSARLLSRMTEISTEERIARIQQESAALLRLAAVIYGAGEGQAAPETRLSVPWLGGEAEIWLQDVGGLVDLNTAGAELLDALAAALEIPPEAMARYRAWRRTPYRLQTVQDFGRVAEIDWKIAQRLDGLATVYSGRFGIAPDSAPTAVLDALGTGQTPLRAEWTSPPSGTVFELRLRSDGGERILGVIALGNLSTPGRVLEGR